MGLEQANHAVAALETVEQQLEGEGGAGEHRLPTVDVGGATKRRTGPGHDLEANHRPGGGNHPCRGFDRAAHFARAQLA